MFTPFLAILRRFSFQIVQIAEGVNKAIFFHVHTFFGYFTPFSLKSVNKAIFFHVHTFYSYITLFLACCEHCEQGFTIKMFFFKEKRVVIVTK